VFLHPRWLYTGDPNAPDEYYNAALGRSGQSYNQNKGGAHSKLAVIGVVPGAGALASATNAALYALEGEQKQAGLSLLEAAGSASLGLISKARKAKQAADALKAVEEAKKAQKAAQVAKAAEEEIARVAPKVRDAVAKAEQAAQQGPSFRTGPDAERYLAKLHPLGEPQVKLATGVGRGNTRFRIIDVLAERIAREAKVGFQTPSWRIVRQIAKDAWLLRNGVVDDVVWHFFRSAITGKIGASEELLKLLAKAGIKWILHS
jgi:hypothetical protein